LTEGTLSATGEIIGVHGKGYFIHGSDNNTVGYGGLTLGRWSDASGNYDISSIYAYLSAASETIGDEGAGFFNHQYGASNQVTGDLILGKSGGSTGLYNMSSPFSDMVSNLSANNLYIGSKGYGSILQESYSTTTLTNNLVLGQEVGSQGNYFMLGGNFYPRLTAQNEYIGYSGHGLFQQSGGNGYDSLSTSSNIVSMDLIVGHLSGAVGEYQLFGGYLSAGREVIGSSGTGTFTQTGGLNTCTGLTLGDQAGGSGTYKFQDGLLSTAQEIIGNSGSGTFTQSLGEHNTGILTLGNYANSQGTFNLQGGSFGATQETVGVYGTGTFNQSGGTNWVATLLTIGNSSGTGGSGTYNYLGGILIAPDVQVYRTGTLQGFGTIYGNVNNAGIVHPSLLLPLTVDGHYTQAAGGTLHIELGSLFGSTLYSRLIATTASLDGKIKPVLISGYYPQVGKTYYGVVTATEGVTGTFSSVDQPPNQIWSAIYYPDSVDLQLVSYNYSSAMLKLNANEMALAKMLDMVAPGSAGDMASVLFAIDSLNNAAGIKNAYKQISPEKAGAFSTLGFALAANQMRNLSQRITDLRFGAGQTSAGLGPGSFNLTYSRVGGLMLAYNSSNLSGLITAKQEKVPASPWSVYLQPNLILGAQATTANQTGFDFTAAGFTLGADYRLRDDLLLGLATGYSNTSANFRGSGGSVTNNTWPIMAYAAYLPQPFYAFGSLGYNLNLLNLERHLAFGGLSRTASSSTTGNQLNAYGETGYDFKFQRLVATPMLSLAYSQLWVNGYTESGAGALSLALGPQSATSLQTGVGGKLALPLRRNSTLMVPQVYASYQHEFFNDTRGLDARLSQSASTFTWQTNQPQRDFAMLGANCTISKDRLTIQLDYNTEVGRGNYTAHNVNATVRWQF
jgi:uncharacterized protein with beta-barrel porin domain